MNDKTELPANPDDKSEPRDYRDTLYLPKTEFPMRAGLPKREPEILAKWQADDIHGQLRQAAKGRDKFVLHDGPPYANGNIHIGTGLNKILKDILSRSQSMMGKDSPYVPGWDCHGLPIEWKIEEQYRAKGRDKDAVPINEFRRECREFASKWIDVQREEFKRLGVVGDWDNPYLTMAYDAEAQIARELMKFAMNGGLYRGSKPVMWSVVEKTALAEAEVEYHDYESDTIWVKFPITQTGNADLAGVPVVIWTTTPWTIPGNRAVSYSSRITYGLYEVTDAPEDNWAKKGEKLILADALAEDVFKQSRVDSYSRLAGVSPDDLKAITCSHPLKSLGYDFDVPLFDGEHVTDEAGTGFVHTAPSHGREDFEVWSDNVGDLKSRGIDTSIPFTVDADGVLTENAPGFAGKRVLKPNGKKGDANPAVIAALSEAGALLARGRMKHQYPHSWRSKAPVIFRNTPQWFIAMEDEKGSEGLRGKALTAIDATRFVPEMGQNRLRAMIESRPDWVISRQRAWGVPICVFTHGKTDQVIPSANWAGADELQNRIATAFESEGADAWFAEGAKQRFLEGLVDNVDDWEQVTDILDVWFDSGSTHAFVLEKREQLRTKREHEGGNDKVLYLEGSDQHRGWFHSSLLESCGTRGRAPYDIVVTHGFTMAEDGRKMSKSLGNQVFPQDIIKQNGADILRLWVASTDYTEDQRIGAEIIKSNVDAYRKLRNTMRWMLGNLAHFTEDNRVEVAEMPELERVMLHRLAELDGVVRRAYEDFDFRAVYTALFNFAIIDLSAFYFDIRKDTLYCDAPSSKARQASLTVLDEIFARFTVWMAPLLVFTMEECWTSRHGENAKSVHLQTFPETPMGWRNDSIAGRWDRVRQVRRVVTGALEIERREKRIGSSLEAAPIVYINDELLLESVSNVNFQDVCITSDIDVRFGEGPAEAFRIPEVLDVSVVPALAKGQKCARSWKVLEEVGSDPDYPELTLRDAAAMREIDGAIAS